MDLAIEYRPKTPAELVGPTQRKLAESLQASLAEGNIVNPLLLLGDSGLGKTTIAKMYASWLDADPQIHNCRNLGTADLQSIFSNTLIKPIMADYVVHIFDEVGELTAPQQSVLLTILEELPTHFVTLFTTLTPGKLRKDLKSRMTIHTLPPIPQSELKVLMWRILQVHGWAGSKVATDAPKHITSIQADQLLALANGNARSLLKYLGSFMRGEPLNGFDETAESDNPDFVTAIFKGQGNIYEILSGYNNNDDLTGTVIQLCNYALAVLANPKSSPTWREKATNVILTLGDYSTELPHKIRFAHKITKLGG